MATIRCHDCGAQRERCPANTRYCVSCRLLRNLEFWLTKTDRCMECKTRFAPIERGDRYCASCNPGSRGYVAVCALCQKEGRLMHRDIRVCVPCSRSPEMRMRLYHALERGQAKRAKANGLVAA